MWKSYCQMHSENTLYLSRKDIICVVVSNLEIINVVCRHSLGSLTDGNLFFYSVLLFKGCCVKLKKWIWSNCLRSVGFLFQSFDDSCGIICPDKLNDTQNMLNIQTGTDFTSSFTNSAVTLLKIRMIQYFCWTIWVYGVFPNLMNDFPLEVSQVCSSPGLQTESIFLKKYWIRIV